MDQLQLTGHEGKYKKADIQERYVQTQMSI